jgi:hypothetical protein
VGSEGVAVEAITRGSVVERDPGVSVVAMLDLEFGNVGAEVVARRLGRDADGLLRRPGSRSVGGGVASLCSVGALAHTCEAGYGIVVFDQTPRRKVVLGWYT